MSRPRAKVGRASEGDLPLAPAVPVEPPLFDGELAPAPPQQPGELGERVEIDSQDFESGVGEGLDRTLDLETWRSDLYLAADWERIEREFHEAVEQQTQTRRPIRKQVFPLIATRPGAPKGAGVFRATPEQLRSTQTNILFNGGVEACDGTCTVHDTLPLTITQIGVCLVSYQGEQGAWAHRVFRRDLRMRGQDPVQEALDLLERRQQRAGVDQESKKDQLSELLRRGLMSYMERAALLNKSKAPWLMGHGQPAPYELLTGSGCMPFLHRSLDLLSELVLERRRFVFVPSAPGERGLLMLGDALLPYEFAIVETAEHRIRRILEGGNLRSEHRDRAEEFTAEVAPQIVVGVYRTYEEAPPQLFYAHADFAQDAALIAMADSLLQPQRSFPTLIDLADNVCSSLFGAEGFRSAIQTTYAKLGHPLRYLGERETRR